MKQILSAILLCGLASGTAPASAAPLSPAHVVLASAKSVDLAANTVTLPLHKGSAKGKAVWYVITDASDSAAAAKRLKKLRSGAIPIDVFFNGSKQGIPFTALHGRLGVDATSANSSRIGSPLNVQATFPAPNNGASGYSPLWSVFPAAWTKAAASSGKETVVTSNSDVQKLADAALVTSPDGKAFGAAGITVNCPVVAFAEKRP